MSDKLKIMSLNVRGLCNFKKRRSIFNWCRKSAGDLVFLQETHSVKENERQWQHEWGGKIIFSHGCSNSRGVAIVFCNGSNTDLKDVYKDDRGRILVIEIMNAEKHFSLINIYAPNVEQAQSCFYTDLKQLLLERNFDEKDNIILCGDFNCVLNVNVDKKGGIEKPSVLLIKLITLLIYLI